MDEQGSEIISPRWGCLLVNWRLVACCWGFGKLTGTLRGKLRGRGCQNRPNTPTFYCPNRQVSDLKLG